jgi:hypothetical protein
MATVKSIRHTRGASGAVDTASAAMLVGPLGVHVRALRDDVRETDQVRLEALVTGLGSVLESVAHSDDPAEVNAPVRQARALLEMLEDALPGDSSASRQIVLQSIASIQALLGVPSEQRAIDESDGADARHAAKARPSAGTDSEAAARQEVGRSAAFEVQVLSEMLREHIVANDPGAETAVMARGVLKRISDLSDIMFEAVFQDEAEREDLETLERRLGDK